MLEIFEVFINQYFEGKIGSGVKQAKPALKHWENHIGQDPYRVVHADVDRFSHKKLYALKKKDRLKEGTLSAYLFYIAKFYDWLGRGNQPDSAKYTALANYIMKKSRKVKSKEIVEPDFIDVEEVVKMLTEITELKGKLLIRLLVFSKIQEGCLKNLGIGDIYNERNYEMDCKGKTIRGVLYSDTPEVINAIKERRKLTIEDKLVDISVRQIQYLIPKYAKKVGITKRVTPRDLKEFGKNQRLRKLLIREYESTKKKST